MTDLVPLAFPAELIVFGIVAGGMLIIVGARRVGLRLIMLTVAAALIIGAAGPIASEFGLMSGVPIWLNVGIALVVGLLVCQALIRFIFGSQVANQTVGNILSSFIIALATIGVAPLRWLQRALRLIRGDTPRD